MKTLEETKDLIAVKHGFVDWIAVIFYHNWDELNSEQLSEIVDEVATEYSRQMCDLQIEKCAEKAKLTIGIGGLDNPITVVDKESIRNTPNVVTTK